MAWRITKVEEQRRQFIEDYLGEIESVTELCRLYQISRKTAYKWIERFTKKGFDGLKDQSKAPYNQTNKTSEDIVTAILDLKRLYENWGPKKILARLEQDYPFIAWPSRTTIDKLFDIHQLTKPRKYRKRYPAKKDPLSHCHEINDVWCIDFKGWFKTKDNIKCDPLTLTDAFSRYLIYCSKLGFNTCDYVWKVLNESFYKYGLPKYLRHDNGPPFATNSAGRLSRLSINLIKAGVIPEWIEPGKPYQNGRHERMHLTLQKEMIPKLTMKEQQKKLVEFQIYFNDERPHEALGQRTPGSVYRPSSRIWNGQLKSPEYSEECIKKRVSEGGQISWQGKEIFIGKVLKKEYVGIKEAETGDWEMYYGPVLLGSITPEKEFIQPRKERKNNKFKVRIF